MSGLLAPDLGPSAADLARPAGILRLAVLLMLDQRPGHGYDLMGRLAELGIPRSNPGKTYRALRWLEVRDLVVPSWDTTATNGPARRVYRASEEGLALLDTEGAAILRRVAEHPAGRTQTWVKSTLRKRLRSGEVHSFTVKLLVDVHATGADAARRKIERLFAEGRLTDEVTVAAILYGRDAPNPDERAENRRRLAP